MGWNVPIGPFTYWVRSEMDMQISNFLYEVL